MSLLFGIGITTKENCTITYRVKIDLAQHIQDLKSNEFRPKPARCGHCSETEEIQPAEAGFVCVDAVSTARSSEEIQPAEAGFVCVDAVSTARSSLSVPRR